MSPPEVARRPAVPWPMRRPLKRGDDQRRAHGRTQPAVPWPMRRPLKLRWMAMTRSLPAAGSALADEEAIETRVGGGDFQGLLPAVPWPMRRPLKLCLRALRRSGLALPAVPWPMRRPLKHSPRATPITGMSLPAVPWPMRRPLKLISPRRSRRPCASGSALADEEAIETRHLQQKHPCSAAGSALADEEAIETSGPTGAAAELLIRQCLGR